MRTAIHALKYDGLSPIANQLGTMLAQAIVQLQPDAPQQMLVIPIPLHNSRRRQRGFNQAHLLTKYALKKLHHSHPHWQLTFAPDLLIRERATNSQSGLTPRQRRLNLRKAFAVKNAHAIADRHILIIDDILTTGATVRTASTALMHAGASSVYVATLARARSVNQIRPTESLFYSENLKRETAPASLSQSEGDGKESSCRSEKQ